ASGHARHRTAHAAGRAPGLPPRVPADAPADRYGGQSSRHRGVDAVRRPLRHRTRTAAGRAPPRGEARDPGIAPTPARDYFMLARMYSMLRVAIVSGSGA